MRFFSQRKKAERNCVSFVRPFFLWATFVRELGCWRAVVTPPDLVLQSMAVEAVCAVKAIRAALAVNAGLTGKAVEAENVSLIIPFPTTVVVITVAAVNTDAQDVKTEPIPHYSNSKTHRYSLYKMDGHYYSASRA